MVGRRIALPLEGADRAAFCSPETLGHGEQVCDGSCSGTGCGRQKTGGARSDWLYSNHGRNVIRGGAGSDYICGFGSKPGGGCYRPGEKLKGRAVRIVDLRTR